MIVTNYENILLHDEYEPTKVNINKSWLHKHNPAKYTFAFVFIKNNHFLSNLDKMGSSKYHKYHFKIF